MILAGDWAPGQKLVINSFNQDGQLILSNLEGPVLDINSLTPAPKAGPHLCNQTLPDCRAVFALANNHIMDYGEKGLERTLNKLKTEGFDYVGAGLNKFEASKALYIDAGNLRFAILSCCEAQFGIASHQKAGVALLDESIYQKIRQVKDFADILILSVHAASEMCPWPSPKWQDKMRSLIDAGVNIVHGHHSHIPQGFEVYGGGYIFYGMGNFCMDPTRWNDKQNTDWSITAKIGKNDSGLNVDIKPLFVQLHDDETLEIKLGSKQQRDNYSAYLNNCNYPLADRALLTGLWQENSIRLYNQYYSGWLNFKRQSISGNMKAALRDKLKHYYRFFKTFGKGKTRSTNKNELLWYLLFACDSHRDAISTALGLLSGELDDCRTEETRMLCDEMMPWSKEFSYD